MTHVVEIQSDILYIHAAGEFSLEEAKRTFLAVLDAVGQHKIFRIVFDGRDIRGVPTTLERFDYAKFVADETFKLVLEHKLPSLPRFAYVLQEPVLDPQSFGETVAVNRGAKVKTFRTVEEATCWLDS